MYIYQSSLILMDCYLCAVRKKSVLSQHKAICCDHCNQWVHIKRNNLDDLDYNLLKSKNKKWYYIVCTPESLPFCQIIEKLYIPKGNLNKPTGVF